MGIFGHKHKTVAPNAGKHNNATASTGVGTTGMHEPGHSAGPGVDCAGARTAPYSSGDAQTAGTIRSHDHSTMGGRGHDIYPSGVGYGQQIIPPTSSLSQAPNERHGGSGQRMAGKVEQAVGGMVGSDALKAKGMQKEHEANTIKLQSQELAEAERLEREAALRRERAVAHGAHPDNKHPGGMVKF